MRRLALWVLVTALTASAATATSAQGAPHQPVKKGPHAVASQAWWGSTCGAPVRKADGSLWKCSLEDDFNGTTLDRALWRPQTDMSSGSGTSRACYVDDHKAVSVSGGALHLSARRTTSPVTCDGYTLNYAVGEVTTYHLFSQQYGRFEARIKAAPTDQHGLQEAFWLWPDDRYPSDVKWPAAGEIDIAETYSQYPGLAVPFLHYTADDNGGPKRGLNTAQNCAAQRGVYNTYDLTWSPTRLTIQVNGKTCLVNTSGDPAFKKRYIVDLTAALGVGPNKPTSALKLPATMDIDYVKVWR